MKHIIQIMAAFLLALWLPSCQDTQNISVEKIIAQPASRNMEAMGWVTGLHMHFIDGTGFEFRVLEMDGSSSVALNPIYLYLLVTNNATGGDEQTRLVALPQASQIEKVRFFGSEPRLEIDVLLDRTDEAGMITFQIPATFEVIANIEDAKLKGNIEVVVRKPQPGKP